MLNVIINSFIRVFYLFLRLSILCYIALSALLYFFQEHILFHPNPLRNNSDAIKLHETTYEHDSVKLHGWKLKPGNKNLLIYYGGNGEELSAYISDYKGLENYTALLINYRGYGLSTGEPSEENLFKDALYIYDQEMKQGYDKVVLAGRSLGSGIAVYVASQRKTDGLILFTPYDSIENVAKDRYFMFPVSLLLKHKFESVKYASEVTSPTLMLIAENDFVIQRERTDALIQHWKAPFKEVIIEHSNHNSISRYSQCWNEIEAFLSKVRKQAVDY